MPTQAYIQLNTDGSGKKLDTVTTTTLAQHRQVFVVGDPATDAGVAPVDATAGLKVDLGADNDVVVTNAGTFAVQSTLQAGSAIAGKFGIDQTTPGTTNGVQVNAALPAGTNAIGKLAANSGVDIGDVDVTSVTPGTTATSLGKAEDAAHTSGDVGVMALAVRNDAMGTLTSTDGDYSPISATSTGRLLVTPAPSSAMVRGSASVAGTGDTSLVAASGNAGLKTYITNLSFANTGSSNTLITVKDGSGGSTLFYTIAPAGGGSNIQLDIPIVTTANTALYFACGTSSTTVYATATGYLAP